MAKKANKGSKKRWNPHLPSEFITTPPKELWEEGQILAGEIFAHRKAILKLAALSLDHERRIRELEDALSELTGEEELMVDVEKEDATSGHAKW